MKINFFEQELILHHSGVAFWPSQKIGIVSDLHLEKGSHFALRGFFLPPYDSHDTLSRLLSVCVDHSIDRLIILGDSFHDPKGYERMDSKARDMLNKLHIFDPVWIKGNHDVDFVPENFKAYNEFECQGITFRHQAVEKETAEISGHFHPKISLNGGRLQRDCFITDGHKMIMPAFGAYTGGLSVQDPVIKSLFNKDCEAYPLGEDRVYRLKLTQE